MNFEMEKAENWDREGVINQLTEGLELTKKLKKQLHSSTNSRGGCGFLAEKIVSCYDNALALLNCRDFQVNGLVVEGSPRSEVSDQDFKDPVSSNVHKKRKNLGKWSEEVRVCSETGFEGQLDDGYNWRKYGQKDILGATHPRAYYRCTHRHTQGCLATKQVQRGEDDPSLFNVVYRGKHTCVILKQNKENVVEESKRLPPPMTMKINVVEPQQPIPESVETQLNLSEPTSDVYFSMSPPCDLNKLRIDDNFLTIESYFNATISNSASEADFAPGDLDSLIDQVDFDSKFVEAADYFSHVQDD